ncbi:MAG: hypothetical protein J1F11_03220, partial [Oscillospiraceae bacterium]|nr:hypothetical protein [Oscillospiraceae bacterium]
MELDHPAEFFETSPIVLKCRKKASDIAGSDAFKRYAALFGGKYMPAAFFVIFLIFSIHIFNDFYFDDPLTQLYYYAASEGQGILPNTLIGFLIPKTTNGMVISNSLKLLYVLMGFIISLCAAGIVKHCAKSGRQKLAGFITAVCFMAFILTQILCLDNFVLNAAVSFTLASVTAYLLVRDRLLFLVPVLCCGAALADLRFAFIFFPYIAAVFLSRIFIRPSENRKKLCLLFALTGLIVLASLFVHYYLTRSMSYTGQNTAFMESFIAANDVPALVYTSFSGYLHDLLNMPAIGLVPSKLPVNLVNGIFLYISFYTADKLRTHWGSKAPAVCYALLLCCIAVLLAVPIIFELNHILPVTCTFFAANGILFLYANESTVKEHL